MNAEQMLEIVKTLRKDATTQGITTGTGLNFYYLEEQAKAIYPVFYPLLNSIPRVNAALFGNTVGGTGVNWKAITGIDVAVNGIPGYPAISEGNRNAFMAFREKDYFSAYKYIGKDGEVTFQAQKTGLGFEDNLNMTQISLLNALLNDEERQILYGNSGSAGNGYQLGTTNTPTATLVGTGGTIPTGKNVSLFCVALTPWGVFLATSTGVQLPFARQNSNGSVDVLNGGTAAISAASNIVTTATNTASVTGAVTATIGAVGYAWFVNSTDAAAPSLANAYFSQVTTAGTVTITALPVTTNQKGNAVSTAGSLTTDNSANALDFDGILTWGFNYASATPSPSYVKDLAGANLTSGGDGTIVEFETLLDFLWNQYKLSPDAIYLGGTLIDSVSKKIAGAGTNNSVTRLLFDKDEKGALIGGTFPIAYRSKYGAGGGQKKIITVETHPWLPNGVIYFDLKNNPYPAAGQAIPAVRRIVTLEDHFSIKWPYRTLQHEVGTYCFLTLQHYIPFGIGILTGVGNG